MYTKRGEQTRKGKTMRRKALEIITLAGIAVPFVAVSSMEAGGLGLLPGTVLSLAALAVAWVCGRKAGIIR